MINNKPIVGFTNKEKIIQKRIRTNQMIFITYYFQFYDKNR